MIFDRDGHSRGPLLRRGVAAIIVLITLCSIGSMARAEPSPDLQRYLDLPLTNRDASRGPGGVHSALPTDPAELRTLLDQARGQAVAPSRYAALLFQYWLVEATDTAGIDLAAWDPRAGVAVNRDNLIRSYRLYEDLQLERRELQWAGMGGMVGADFGGGLIDFELMTNAYDLPPIQQSARAVVGPPPASPARTSSTRSRTDCGRWPRRKRNHQRRPAFHPRNDHGDAEEHLLRPDAHASRLRRRWAPRPRRDATCGAVR